MCMMINEYSYIGYDIDVTRLFDTLIWHFNENQLHRLYRGRLVHICRLQLDQTHT